MTTAALLLTGCKSGGGGGGDVGVVAPPPPPPPVANEYAGVIYRRSADQGDNIVDLSANLNTVPTVSFATREAFRNNSYVAEASLIDGQDTCSDPTIAAGDRGIQVLTQGYGDCTFDVHMVRDGKETREKLIVNYTSSLAQQVPALSQVLTPGSSATIDLATHADIKPFIDAGYLLESNTEIFGDISAIVNSNSLSLTAGNNLGPNRVFYFLKKTDGTTVDSKIGIVDVTVTSAANNGPVVTQPNLAHTIKSRAIVDFDLSRVVTDPDVDAELQIIRLDSPLGGSLGLGTSDAPVEGYAPKNMAFHFSSDIIGSYPVFYSVTDHKGGYAAGNILINVGLLTSPNTPLANNPGRMVESISVGNNVDNILMLRPHLLKEVQQVIPAATGGNSQDGETWAYLGREEADKYCQAQGVNWRTPTATAMTALINKYKKDMTGSLGWPTGTYNTAPTSVVFYNIQKTGRKETETHTTINAVTGELSTEKNGIVTCVISPQTVLGLDASEIILRPDNNTYVTPVRNWTYSVAPVCELIEGEAGTASCTAEVTEQGAQVTITGGTPGVSRFLVKHPVGETLTGTVEPVELTVVNNFDGTAKPTITAYTIEAQLDGAWVPIATQTGIVSPETMQRVRTGTWLRVQYTYNDPDSWQPDAGTTIVWSGSASVNPVFGEQNIWSAGLYGDATVTITPKNAYESGVAVSRTLTLTNQAPSISVALTYDGLGGPVSIRGGEAFQNDTVINATPDYSDPNGDPEDLRARSITWKTKNPWMTDWVTVSPWENEPILSDSIRDSFFIQGSPTRLGYDLQVTVTTAEVGGEFAQPVIKSIIPVAKEDTPNISVPGAASNPASATRIIHRGTVNLGVNPTLDVYDAFCRDAFEDQPGPGRLLRNATRQQLDGMLPAPKYYARAYKDFSRVPYLDSDGTIKLWNLSPGAQGREGIICELIPTVK